MAAATHQNWQNCLGALQTFLKKFINIEIPNKNYLDLSN